MMKRSAECDVSWRQVLAIYVRGPNNEENCMQIELIMLPAAVKRTKFTWHSYGKVRYLTLRNLHIKLEIDRLLQKWKQA